LKKKNYLHLVNFMVNQEADSSIKNVGGKAPLHLAEERNHAAFIYAYKTFTSQVEWPTSETEQCHTPLS
jgi:hypothetical protein